MNSDKLYRLALLVLFILITVQLINILTKNTTEHMNPALLNHQFESWPNPRGRDNIPPPSDGYKTQFYLKNNIYAADKISHPTLTNPIPIDEDLSCGPQYDWNKTVEHSPGANNTYGDMVWAVTSPKMQLQTNCMSCGDFGPSKKFNDPSGVESSVGAYYSEDVEEQDGYKLM